MNARAHALGERGLRLSMLALSAVFAVGASGASAQDAAEPPSSVANSGMQQGEASINVRADFKLAIKGARATPVERVQQLTDAVTPQLSPMRKCYSDLIRKRPATVGSIAMQVMLETGARRAKLETTESGGTDKALTDCVTKALLKASFSEVTRPAFAVVTLEFDNSRAKGQAAMEQSAAAIEQIEIKEGASGGFEASWASNDGKVAFDVRSDKSKEAVEATLKTLRDAYGGFADCRRRSEKDGLSPAGRMELQVQLQRGGESALKVLSSTVAHERAVPCVERVWKRITFEGAPPAQRVHVSVTWSG